MQILDIKKRDRILIIAPHPDDECIGAGGVQILYPKQCKVLVLTDGRQGQGEVAPEIEKEIRKIEFIKEMHEAGISDFQMLEIEDGSLMQHLDCLEAISLTDFSKIFVTGIHDNHPDHTAACLSLFQALQKQKIDNVEVYLYEVHTPLQETSHMLDITSVIDRKEVLIQFHQSQLKSLPYDRYARCMAEYRALQNRMDGHYIEVYQNVQPNYLLDKTTIEWEKRLQKSTLFYWILTRWVALKIEGHSVSELLRPYGCHSVAVYGYAELGRLLCQELRNDSIKVLYVLDKKVTNTNRNDLPIFTPSSNLPPVEMVIVTAVYYFDEIKKELTELGYKNVLSFRQLLEGNI